MNIWSEFHPFLSQACNYKKEFHLKCYSRFAGTLTGQGTLNHGKGGDSSRGIYTWYTKNDALLPVDTIEAIK